PARGHAPALRRPARPRGLRRPAPRLGQDARRLFDAVLQLLRRRRARKRFFSQVRETLNATGMKFRPQLRMDAAPCRPGIALRAEEQFPTRSDPRPRA